VAGESGLLIQTISGSGLTVVLANLEVADECRVCLHSFDSVVRHFSVVLAAAFVVVRSSQNCITLQGSRYSQATVGQNEGTLGKSVTGAQNIRILRKPHLIKLSGKMPQWLSQYHPD